MGDKAMMYQIVLRDIYTPKHIKCVVDYAFSNAEAISVMIAHYTLNEPLDKKLAWYEAEPINLLHIERDVL